MSMMINIINCKQSNVHAFMCLIYILKLTELFYSNLKYMEAFAVMTDKKLYRTWQTGE